MTTAQRLGVVAFIILFAGAEGLLITAVRTADEGEQRFVKHIRETGEATDVGFALSQMLIEIEGTGRLDVPEVVEQLQLARRHLEILVHRVDQPGAAADIGAAQRIDAALFEVEALAADDPTNVRRALELLEGATSLAKQQADASEQATFSGVLEVVDNNRARDQRTILVSLLIAIVGALVLGSVTRRFRGAYQRAYEAVVDRTGQLELANERLRAADRAKDHFVSVVSHELRTPLTAILGFTETMQRRAGQLDADQQALMLSAIERQALRQERLVEDLLIAARLQHEGAALAPVRVSIAAELRRSADDLGVALALHGEPDQAVAWADVDAVRRITDNLLSNARKYGGPNVEATLARTRRGVVAVLRDDGAGVPVEFRAHVFEPFAQADQGDQRRSSGFGLGLSIARDLARASGGDLRLLDTADGTAFEVVLPSAEDVADVDGPTSTEHEAITSPLV